MSFNNHELSRIFVKNANVWQRKRHHIVIYGGIRGERPDYYYLKNLFRELRNELVIKVTGNSKKLPYVPTEEEMKVLSLMGA
ncbi:hypothetical protein [Pseudobacteroides cellulosolvens]|uniref:hypothetical protein n=1 Tax=Pseudobacteroides cellulosolvens TaxID=35825 RepID=UPI001A9A58E0|nr:hypothetical protein [Pseudobacteroides cellulosolvens]